ncbi:MAG: hypothetical protein IKF35_01520 [Solobacterium sp.]|nr:hypothetical protein [Solobacterium sp.]
MKKTLIAGLLPLFLLTSCSARKDPSEDTSNGPVTTPDELTDAEKELLMIQGCIEDYNNDLIAEREEYYQMVIPPMPLELDQLPAVNSLNDLKPEAIDSEQSNITYAGSIRAGDRYDILFIIYKPSVNGFWLHGDIEFRVNPDDITVNDPQFADSRAALSPLLNGADDILNRLYGIDVSFDESTEDENGYCLCTDGAYPTIDSLKAAAESIYTKEFLETAYYPSAFEGEFPVYKEENGRLYVLPSELVRREGLTYHPEYIIAAQENGDELWIDLLASQYGQLQPVVYRLVLKQTEAGYRLPAAL